MCPTFQRSDTDNKHRKENYTLCEKAIDTHYKNGKLGHKNSESW